MRQVNDKITTGGIRERTPGEIEEAIFDMAIRGWTPTQIERQLPAVVQALAKKEGWTSWKVPHLRTIQRIHRRARKPDSSGQWSPWDVSADDARIVLDFISEAINATEGRITGLTRGEAETVVRLRRIAPALDFYKTVRLSSLLEARTERKQSTGDVDAFVAYAPWRGQSEAATYFTAVLRRWVPPAPQWLVRAVPAHEWFGFEVVAGIDPNDRAIEDGRIISIIAIPYIAGVKPPSGDGDPITHWLSLLGKFISEDRDDAQG